MASDPHNTPVPPPSHEERMVLAAMRARWEAMFRGSVEDEELDRVLQYLETPVSMPEPAPIREEQAGSPRGRRTDH